MRKVYATCEIFNFDHTQLSDSIIIFIQKLTLFEAHLLKELFKHKKT